MRKRNTEYDAIKATLSGTMISSPLLLIKERKQNGCVFQGVPACSDTMQVDHPEHEVQYLEDHMNPLHCTKH